MNDIEKIEQLIEGFGDLHKMNPFYVGASFIANMTIFLLNAKCRCATREADQTDEMIYKFWADLYISNPMDFSCGEWDILNLIEAFLYNTLTDDMFKGVK